MKLSIYLPDALAERVRANNQINYSAICQEALSNEVERQERLAEQQQMMARIEVSTASKGDVAFTGREIYHESLGTDGEITVYLTRLGALVLVETIQGRTEMHHFDTFEDLEQNRFYDESEAMLSAISGELGTHHVTELDI